MPDGARLLDDRPALEKEIEAAVAERLSTDGLVVRRFAIVDVRERPNVLIRDQRVARPPPALVTLRASDPRPSKVHIFDLARRG